MRRELKMWLHLIMQLSKRSSHGIRQLNSISQGIHDLTYLSPRSAPLNDDITGFTSFDQHGRYLEFSVVLNV